MATELTPDLPAIGPHHLALALCLGPLAYWAAGFTRRAAVVGAVMGLALVGWGYWYYLGIFLAIDGPGESVRDVVDTSIRANVGLANAWRQWLPGDLGILALGNVGCALDLARLRGAGGADR